MTRKYSSLRVGLIARSDYSGLGFQTRELYKLLNPTKVILIDSTPFNQRAQHPEWYDSERTVTNMGFIEHDNLANLLSGIDVLVSCEIFYNHQLPKVARRMGVKTVLQPNAELNQYFVMHNIPKPDVFFLPSPWLEDETRSLGVPCYVVQPPVVEPRTYKQIPKGKGNLKVLHFGGRRAAGDRNGTEIIRNMAHIQDVCVDIHDQGANEVEDQRELYEQGHHVVLIPRRYGGLCLPMLESLSYGLPVIMPNIEPNRNELPAEWLTQASKGRSIRTKRRIETYDPDLQTIIWALERFRDMDQEQYDVERAKANARYKAHQDQLSLWKTLIEKVVK